jgi:hypothetical protein
MATAMFVLERHSRALGVEDERQVKALRAELADLDLP